MEDDQPANQGDRDVLMGELDVTVSFSSALTAVTIFFTGLLITQYSSFNPSVNVPILFLIMSTFGFLYSTLIYANTSGLIARLGKHKAEKSIVLGNIISEYIGVYFLILSIPLIINVVTQDLFLRYATAIVDICGLTIYHFSGFSMMARHFKRLHYAFLSIIIFLEILLILIQFANTIAFSAVSVILILFIIFLGFLAEREE